MAFVCDAGGHAVQEVFPPSSLKVSTGHCVQLPAFPVCPGPQPQYGLPGALAPELPHGRHSDSSVPGCALAVLASQGTHDVPSEAFRYCPAPQHAPLPGLEAVPAGHGAHCESVMTVDDVFAPHALQQLLRKDDDVQPGADAVSRLPAAQVRLHEPVVGRMLLPHLTLEARLVRHRYEEEDSHAWL